MNTKYYEKSLLKTENLSNNKHIRILAFESSCDETAVAIVENGRKTLSNVVNSQVNIHKEFGGVVPEIASRLHIENINELTIKAFECASCGWDDIDAIAVTANPGLIGCLIVGVSYAKALAYSKNLPLVAVNHIDGHIAANYLAFPDLSPPYICLVVSGGHSHIVKIDDYLNSEIIGRAIDDAAGEAFDKTARALGLPYPGGPNLEKLALEGDVLAYDFSSDFNSAAHFDFSFSGVKTAVLNQINQAAQKSIDINKADIAASFQKAVTDALLAKSIKSCKLFGYDKLAIAGGVSANKYLRARFESACKNENIALYCPPIELCTDNAAMIGSAAYYKLINKEIADLDLNASAIRN